MAEGLSNLGEIRQALINKEQLLSDPFSVLRELCIAVSCDPEHPEVQELVLRALDVAEAFGSDQVILDGLVRSVGLFPYLDPQSLSLPDQVAYELHRPFNMDEGIVFHGPQAKVYWNLMSGENVVLSAPTSFGKSLIIDAVVASGRYSNILIIVPTIALIDETRRRLSRRFRGHYKIITHSSQSPADRNIIIVTQERVHDAFDLDLIDIFVVDEFYKLNLGEDTDLERVVRLNQVVYELTRRGKQFYMLGPNIAGTSEQFERRLDYKTFIEPYRTVVSELHEVPQGQDDFERLIVLCKRLSDPTMIFCSSPNRAMEVVKELTNAELGQQSQACRELADWVAQHYHPDWHFVQALRKGLGVHHGRIPRAIQQQIVQLFNSGDIIQLVCTSTLIEGVNTKAKNIILFDNTINRRSIDLFTFNNIRGRSGRMGEHFIGHVYLFHSPPGDDLPEVDIPAYSQPQNAPDSLLIQVDEADLSEASKERLQKYLIEDVLDYETLKLNVGMEPERQLAMAREIAGDIETWHRRLNWTGLPTYRQVFRICELIWRHFDGRKLGSGSVRSASQLALLINRLRQRPSAAEMVTSQAAGSNDIDSAVQSVLDFLRLWASFHFPRLLRGLDRIQKDVFRRVGRDAGDYEFFAAGVETYFIPPEIVALDEYGIPLELGRKLAPLLDSGGALDTALEKLRAIDPEQLVDLSTYEKRTIREVQELI